MLPRRTQTNPTIGDSPIQESEEWSPENFFPPTPVPRPIADTLEPDVPELQGDEKAELPKPPPTFQEELAAFRENVESGFTRLERAIEEIKPTPISERKLIFVYTEVAEKHYDDLLKKYEGDLDTSQIFAGLFSGVTTAFIIQIMASTQPNPSDLTNVLLLRLLQQNDSFGGSDPLAPVLNVSSSIVRAQLILFASLAVTLLAAFVTILGRQWVLHYKETSYWGIASGGGTGHQVKFVGLQRSGLHFIMEWLPLLLQLALLLFGIGLTVYLWDLDLPSAKVTLAVTCIECLFYACTTVIATIRKDYPFQTPLSILLSMILCQAKKIRYAQILGLPKRRIVGLFRRNTIPTEVAKDVYDKHHHIKLSNPAFWRQDPLFISPIPEDPLASAGDWLLGNTLDFSDAVSAALAVATEFPYIQWPSHPPSCESLERLYCAHLSCFAARRFDGPTCLKALESAAAYYVLYHSRLVWSASKIRWVEEDQLPRYLPPDLLPFGKGSEQWHGQGLFEYLLHIDDRSASVTSARFLSYIAPYWFCGDSDSAIKSRSSRLPALRELINVLASSKELHQDTLTNCVLCVGAVMDFPLHPEDLIRVKKGAYMVSTFEMVVEHIYQIILASGRHYDHAVQALEILLTLINNCPWTPFLEATWMNELFKRAVVDYTEGRMTEEHFSLFLKLSTRREAFEDHMVDTGVGDSVLTSPFKAGQRPVRKSTPPQAPIPDDVLFSKIIKYIQDRVERDGGWQGDDVGIYHGLLALRDIGRLEHSPLDGDTLQTLHDAMDYSNPLRVSQVAFQVMLVTQDHWLKSEMLRQKLQDLDFFRKLYNFAPIPCPNSDHRRLFLKMTETLSEDVDWHSYLREAMDIWLPFRHDGQDNTLRIMANIGALSPPRLDDHNSLSFDELLQKLVVDEWAAVPGRQARDLAAYWLEPLAEITKRLKELLFDDGHRREVLAVVGKVIPGLERRHGSDYEGPGEDVRDIVNGLVTELGLQPERLQPGESQPGELKPEEFPPTRHRSTYD